MAALCLALLGGAYAQRSTQRRKGPRALALVEWPAKGGSPRVIPIFILVDGRYYDASIYKADPVPMALEPGNVYEVEQSGESIGLVTLTTARQATNGAWLADARFQTNEQLAAARKPRDTAPKSSTIEGPPKLRRGGGRSGGDQRPTSMPPTSTSSTKPSDSPPQTTGSDDDRPVLRKPASDKPSDAAKTGDTPQKPSDSAGAQPSSSTPATTPKQDDAHPVLRRGRPTAEQAENLPGAVETKAPPKAPAAAAVATTASAKAAVAAPGRILPAISDAAGPEPHSFLLPWKTEDQEKDKTSMMKLASSLLQEWARTHGDTRPGELQDVQMRAFDLTTSNEPQLVLMARANEAPAAPVRRTSNRNVSQPASGGGLTYWITLAARVDYNGDLRKLKLWATDSKHLDAYPRAELIDAIDADGDGRGELLFREIYDDGQGFALYRVTPDMLVSLYNSAELEK